MPLSKLQIFEVLTSVSNLFVKNTDKNMEPLDDSSNGKKSVEDIENNRGLVLILSLIPILELCKKLVVMHGSLYLNCSQDDIFVKHVKKVAYMIGNDVWSLNELSCILDYVAE